MPTENYTVQYIADPSAFVAGARQVETLVRSIDQAVTASKKNMSGMFGGSSRSATSAAKKIDQLNAAMAGLTPAADAVKSSLTGLGTAAASAGKKTDMFADLTNGWVTQAWLVAKAWQAAAAALEIYSKAAEDAKKHMNTGAESGLDKRTSAGAREYATLLGKNEVDDDVMKRLFGAAQAGGSSFSGALKYGKQFLGSIETGKKKGHIRDGVHVDANGRQVYNEADDQVKSLEKEGLAFGNRIGLDEETAGDLVGVIPQSVDLTKDEQGNKLTTEQGVDKALGQLGAMTSALMDGRGEIRPLARSELTFAVPAIATGHVRDHAEAGAFASVASTFSKTASSSGTATKQMDRLVNESLGEGGEFLKGIGVADQKGDYDKLRVLKTHVDAQRQASADPSKFDTKNYLQSKGFRNDTEIDSTVAFLDNFEVLGKQIEKGKVGAKNGAAVRQANQQYLTSQTGQAKQAEAIQEAGNYEQTRKRQRLAAARRAAYGQLQAEKKIDTFGTNLVDGFLDGTVNKVNPNGGHEERIDQRVWENYRGAVKQAGLEKEVVAQDPRYLELKPAEAQQLGVQTHGGLAQKGYGGQDPTKLDEALNTFGPQLEAKRVPINGKAVEVKTNTSALPAAGGAVGPAGVQPGAAPANPGAAGGKVASVDATQLDKASDKLASVTDKLDRLLSKSLGTPGANLGGSYGPLRT